MAIGFSPIRALSQGHYLIQAELSQKRALLKDREGDLEQEKRRIAELEGVCISLRSQIAELERDNAVLAGAKAA